MLCIGQPVHLPHGQVISQLQHLRSHTVAITITVSSGTVDVVIHINSFARARVHLIAEYGLDGDSDVATLENSLIKIYPQRTFHRTRQKPRLHVYV